MDGHSGGVPPVPISNTEVKTADVSTCTALRAGKLFRCPPFLFNVFKTIINHKSLKSLMNIDKLQKEMIRNDIDLSLILSLNEEPSTNLGYFAGFFGVGILAVTRNDSFLIVPEYERTKKSAVKKIVVEKKKRIFEKLSELFTEKKFKKIGIEFNFCSVLIYQKLKKTVKGKYVDISKTCQEIRAVKTKEELNFIRKACDVTDNIYEKICSNFHFKTEDEIREFIASEARKNSCDLAFPPIAASNIGSREVHYNGHREIKKGFLMLDFGVKYNGYCSDMTRMLYLGKPNVEEIKDFELVLKTIDECENKVLKKKKFSEIYEESIRLLGNKAKYFTHGLGHGLGLDIHEFPSLYPEEKAEVEENIAFTIEPGIYLEKYGIRLEDTVVIQNKKLVRLTKSKKNLVRI